MHPTVWDKLWVEVGQIVVHNMTLRWNASTFCPAAGFHYGRAIERMQLQHLASYGKPSTLNYDSKQQDDRRRIEPMHISPGVAQYRQRSHHHVNGNDGPQAEGNKQIA